VQSLRQLAAMRCAQTLELAHERGVFSA
jgi:hypothetical protein